jgi:hypothetical protein
MDKLRPPCVAPDRVMFRGPSNDPINDVVID